MDLVVRLHCSVREEFAFAIITARVEELNADEGWVHNHVVELEVQMLQLKS